MVMREFHWNPIDDSLLSEMDGSANALVTYIRELGASRPLLSEDRPDTCVTTITTPSGRRCS